MDAVNLQQEVQQPVTSQTAEQSLQTKNHFFFFKLLLILFGIVVVLGGAGYYFSQHFLNSVQHSKQINIPTPLLSIAVDNSTIHYDQGVNNQKNMDNKNAVEALTFPVLQGEMLVGKDDTYQNPGVKTYAVSEFSFSYPMDYSISQASDGAILITKQVNGNYMGVNQQFTATIKIVSKQLVEPNTSLTDWFLIEDTSFFSNNGQLIVGLIKDNEKSTTLGGQPALFNALIGQPPYLGNDIVAVYKGYGYYISISSFGVPGAAAAFREVISSFKFLQ